MTCSQLRQATGYAPAVDLTTGLADTLAWYAAHLVTGWQPAAAPRCRR